MNSLVYILCAQPASLMGIKPREVTYKFFKVHNSSFLYEYFQPISLDFLLLRCKHTERQAARQASAASEMSNLCNGSETHLERHHRLALVTLPLASASAAAAPLDARCGYAFI